MVYFNIFASVLLVASALVQASPTMPHNDDSWFSGFINALNKAGLTSMSGIYEDFAKTPEGPKLIKTLKSQELTILSPVNSVRLTTSHMALLSCVNASSSPLCN